MEEMLISYVNLEPLTIVYLLNLDGRKISKEPIETQMTKPPPPCRYLMAVK
jgi:hypothetical protein